MMKKALVILLLIVTSVLQVYAAEKNISVVEAKALLDRNKNIFLLDVRTPWEARQGKLPGSVLIPIGELERRLGEVPRDRPIIVYCAVGSRSKSVASFLDQRGYRDVYNMNYGIAGWYSKGLPIQ